MKQFTKLLRNTSLIITAGMLMLAAPRNAAAADDKSPGDSERMTEQAWNAYNNADNESAIQKAELCIKEFRRTADALQQALKDKKETFPPVGEIPEEPQKRAVFNHGPLNDVATCYFLVGEAHLKLAEGLKGDAKTEHLKKARAAYEAAAKYTYARTWDPKGWFWDPSAKANERLEEMEPTGA